VAPPEQRTLRPADPIQVTPVAGSHTIVITAGGKPFTEFIYPDSLEKPTLYPIYAPDGELVTRGCPVKPRTGEPTDHPQPPGSLVLIMRMSMDWISGITLTPSRRIKNICMAGSGNRQHPRDAQRNERHPAYSANWTDQQKNILLKEMTTLVFSASDGPVDWPLKKHHRAHYHPDRHAGCSLPRCQGRPPGLRVVTRRTGKYFQHARSVYR